MDTNTSAPHYGLAPSRISDSSVGPQKTGFSVYGQWQFGDPAVADPDVWTRGLPDASAPHGKPCANPGGSAVCADVAQGTFPPPPGGGGG